MKIIFSRKNIVFLWLEWHFIDIPKEILKVWRNFLLFNLSFFSIAFLFKTFFHYWHKYHWSYGRGFNIKRYTEVFLSNLISRTIGAIIRFFIIIIGLVVEIMVFVIGIVFLVLWLLLPALSIIVLIAGLSLIYYGR